MLFNSNDMRYYYFNPISKQYYFPKGYNQYPIFAKFYQPYKVSATLIWKIWQSSSMFRKLFSTKHPENFLPIEQLKQYVTPCSILTFNMGTKGVEKKISVLGVERSTDTAFYLKYATSVLACRNVFNEGNVLEQLSHLSFVPKLQFCIHEENRFTLIKTTVLNGEKIKYYPIDDKILSILFILSSQKIISIREYESDLMCCFAHGDFCPWNMLMNNGDIELFDWEMAGQYPLGYDLFTYIYQFEFLVKKTMRFELIIESNFNVISQYFIFFGIVDWMPYLNEFSNLKLKLEKEKNNYELIKPYLQLKEQVSNF